VEPLKTGLSSAGLARPGCQMALGLHPTARAGALGWLWASRAQPGLFKGVCLVEPEPERAATMVGATRELTGNWVASRGGAWRVFLPPG
jgi:hypothetical protein